MEDASKEPPVLLIATEGEWAARSLESVLVNHGYIVVRAQDGHDALVAARRTRPDAIILDEHLSGIGGIEVCRQLRDDPKFDSATPIVITSPSPASRVMRTEAFRAGAWDFCAQPIDVDTLLLELNTFIRAKRALADARAQALVDVSTGVLTPAGMERWAEQLAARASRNHEPLACIVLMPSPRGRVGELTPDSDDLTKSVAEFLQLAREYFRRSDVVGRMSDGRLALLAPDTDADGVQGLLARLRSAMDAPAPTGATPSPDFKAGYWAVHDFASAPLEPAELMKRAARALDANVSPGENMAIGFDQLPVS